MRRRTTWAYGKMVMGVALLASTAVAAGSCGTDEHPRSVGLSSPDFSNQDADPATGPCETDVPRACKVQLNEDNCFVGEQACVGGEWGVCVEPEGGFETNSLSAPGDCDNNPCNPECQDFEEDPGPDLTARGTPAPPVAGGTIGDVPSAWANACLQDKDHLCNIQCTTSGACQFDTYCDTPPGDICTPWATGEFYTGDSDPNFTIGVVCDPTLVQVCNRGDTAAGAGVGISAWTPNTNLCGGSCGSQPYTTGQSSVANLQGTCTIPADIAPGECLAVDCSAVILGQTILHVNGCDQFNCVSESNKDDNYGIYDPAITCKCALASQTAALAPVTMFMVLDNSGSMVNQGIWGPAQSATTAFITDPGSDAINLAMRMYGDDPTSGCDRNSCSIAACSDMALGPDLLSNATHESALTSFIANAPTGSNGTPHDASVGGLCAAASTYAQANPTELVAAVYISDGAFPAQCGGTQISIGAHAGTSNINDGVLTFTVGLPQASLGLLDEIAAQGGTTRAIDLTGSTDVDTDLTNALQSIQGSLTSCTLAIPNAASVDPATVIVNYVTSGAVTIPLTSVNNANQCSGGNQFYFEPNAANPTEITLCPTICATVRNDTGSDIDLTGGCAGGYVAYTEVFEYTPDCSGFPSGSGPIWDFLSYDTTIPGDSRVEWELSTSNVNAADAANGPWILVGTSDFANPDAIPSAPIDLRTALGPSSQQQFLALRLSIYPTSDGGSTPVVHDWNIKYSCESIQ